MFVILQTNLTSGGTGRVDQLVEHLLCDQEVVAKSYQRL